VTTRRSPGPSAPAAGANAAARVGAGIFISKVFGFLRERVFAHYFGTTSFAEAWYAALRMPNVIRNLLGEGTLSASLIPVYSEFLEQGRDEDAARFAGAALGILTAVAAALVLVGMGIAPVLVGLFFPRWSVETQALTISLVRILLPMTGLFVISAWSLGILNSHRKFFVSFVAPVLWNLAMIVTMLAGAVYFGMEDRALVEALAWGALVGGALTLGIQLPFLRGHLAGMRVSLGRGVKGVPEAIRNFTPVVAARGVVNLSGWIDMILAGRLMPGALAVMAYSQTLSNLPISLFGTGVAAAELPEMSRMRDEPERILAERVSRSLKRAMYFLIPSALLYVSLGDVVVAALYQTGQFGDAQSLITWGVLAGYAVGLPASASSRVLSSAFYALRDTRTPARMAYVRVAVSVAFGVALMVPADQLGFARLRMGAAGLAVGSSLGAWLEYVLLRRALGRRIGAHGPGISPLVRMTLAAALAGLVGVALQVRLPALHPVLEAVAVLAPFGVVYLGMSSVLGVPLRRSAGS